VRAIHLPIQVGIVVPSTRDVNVPISDAEFDSRIAEVRRYLTRVGGYTSWGTTGGYYSDDAKILVTERGTMVEVYMGKKQWKNRKAYIIKKIHQWNKKWGQESIAIKVENDLYLVEGRE
jgi:hypothetical protein